MQEIKDIIDLIVDIYTTKRIVNDKSMTDVPYEASTTDEINTTSIG